MHRKTLLLAAATCALAFGLGAQAQAQDTAITWKGGPQFKSGDLTFKIGGRVYLDYVMQDVDGEYDALTNPSGTPDSSSRNSRFRTARLGVEGTWNDNWAYKAEVNFAGGETAWEDVVLEYSPTGNTALSVGHFKTVSLENLTSSRYTTFMERGPFNDVLDIGRVVNLGASVNGDNWTAAAYVSGDNMVQGDDTVEVRFRPRNKKCLIEVYDNLGGGKVLSEEWCKGGSYAHLGPFKLKRWGSGQWRASWIAITDGHDYSGYAIFDESDGKKHMQALCLQDR